jgi:hypothetical protein
MLATIALAGCGLIGTTAASGGDQVSPAAPAATGGLGDSVKDGGDLPDPCTLLTESQAADLTGRPVTQIDRDGGAAGDAARYCQWQQDGGQLALFLSRGTEDDFHIKIDGATPVDEIGEAAFQLAGHLYVYYGSVIVDVYARGDDDAGNLAVAKAVVRAVLPKI